MSLACDGDDLAPFVFDSCKEIRRCYDVVLSLFMVILMVIALIES